MQATRKEGQDGASGFGGKTARSGLSDIRDITTVDAMRVRRVSVPVFLLASALLAAAGRSAGPIASAAPSAIGQAAAPGNPLWVTMTPMADDRQMLVIIDPNERTAAVYHVDAATGTMTLKSARSIRWDLLVGEFNAQEPTPSALRKLIEASPPTRP